MKHDRAEILGHLKGDCEPGESVWEAVAGLPEEARVELARELKQHLDMEVRRDPGVAAMLAERLVRIAEELPAVRALGRRGRAVANHASGRFEAAIDDYRAAIVAYEGNGEGLEAARVRRSLVDALQMAGAADEALEIAEQARFVLEAEGEHRLLAQLDCNVGNVWFRLDQFDEAGECYRRAIEGFESLDDATGRAFALYNLGNVETNANRFEAAAECFSASERLFDEAGHSQLAADCRYGAAYLLFRRGRYADAEIALETCAEDFARINKVSGPALCRMDLAELHLRLDAWRDGRDHAIRAADQFAELGMDYEQARASLFAGVACARLELHDEARGWLIGAERTFERLGNKTLAALAVLHRSELPVDSGSAHRDLDLDAASEALEASGDRVLADVGILALARQALRNGKAQRAHALLTEIIDRDDPSLPKQTLTELETWEQLADVLIELNRSDEALLALERAVDVGDVTIGNLAHGDSRLAFRRQHHPARVRWALLHLQGGGDPKRALEAIEHGRRRNLEEYELRTVPQAAHLREARAGIDSLLGRAIERHPSAPTSRNASAPTARLEAAQDSLLADIRAYRSSVAASATTSAMDATPESAVPAGDGLIYFALDDRQVRLIHGVPSEGGLHNEALSITPAELELLAARLRFQVQKLELGGDYASRHGGRIDRALTTLLEELGQRLLEPASKTIDGRPLIIVPYGVLHDLPLHAAIVGGRPLIDHADVSFARSLTELQNARRAREVGGAWMGCFSDEADLPALDEECESIHFALDAEGHELRRLQPDALHDQLDAREPLRALHLASHGVHQPEHPLFSGLRMGGRFLTTLDLQSVSLDCELVSLSGCDTGRSSRSRTDQLHGPEQALLRAGARSVVSSLWPVLDERMADLMGAFYRRLASGDGVRASLSAVLREQVRAGETPLAWAPLIATGDPEARPGIR